MTLPSRAEMATSRARDGLLAACFANPRAVAALGVRVRVRLLIQHIQYHIKTVINTAAE
jgi:hypothetical protein